MSRPNIVVILSDQQRWDTLGCYGQAMPVSPRLDRLASEGTLFRNAFTPQPLCGPARACIQTGLYATATGCHTNNVPLPAGATTIATSLRDEGYETAYFGKWHLGSTELDHHFRPTPRDRRGGYLDRWQAVEVPEFTSNSTGGYLFDEDGVRRDFDGYRPDAFNDLAVQYLEGRVGSDRPFFLFLSLVEPHPQSYRRNHYGGPPIEDRSGLIRDYIRYEGPDRYRGMFADARLPGDLDALRGDAPVAYAEYLASCRAVDDCAGRILEALEMHGLAEETVVIFTSDHGNHFNTRNRNDGKCSCHDASIRIPLIVRGPGFETGSVREDFVSLVDIAPTVFDCAGLEAPSRMHGLSLVKPTNARPQHEAFIQIGQFDVGRVLRTAKWTYAVASAAGDPYGSDFVESHLYDLQGDPNQLANAIDDPVYEEERSALRGRLGEIIASVEGAEAVIEPHRR